MRKKEKKDKFNDNGSSSIVRQKTRSTKIRLKFNWNQTENPRINILKIKSVVCRDKNSKKIVLLFF